MTEHNIEETRGHVARGAGRCVGRAEIAPVHSTSAFLAIVALTIACASSPSAVPAETGGTATSAAEVASPTPTAGSLAPVPGGFDITRVRLMDADTLPDGVPVPVPYGGEIDEAFGAFEGQVLAVEYDARFFPTAAAFYETWIDIEGLESSPLMTFSATGAGWQVTVDGQPVRVEMSISPDGTKTQLAIYWD